MHYATALGQDVFGNITRINNLLNGIPERLFKADQNLQDTQKQLETAKEEFKKPFPMEAELAAKSERLAALDSQLNMDNKVNPPAEVTNKPEPAAPEPGIDWFEEDNFDEEIDDDYEPIEEVARTVSNTNHEHHPAGMER